MELTEIVERWKSYDKKLEESLLFNRRNAEDITRMKVQSFLASMKPIKIFTLVVGILWVVFIDLLIVNLFFIASPYFIVSAIILVLLNKLAIGIYLYQLVLIHEVDISEPILVAQERLSRLRSSTLWVARILFLQLPVWTTFYWNQGMMESGSVLLWTVQIIVTLSFTYSAVWLFLNIRYENRHKKWFRLLLEGREWTPVIRSMDLLDQIDEYKGVAV